MGSPWNLLKDNFEIEFRKSGEFPGIEKISHLWRNPILTIMCTNFCQLRYPRVVNFGVILVLLGVTFTKVGAVGFSANRIIVRFRAFKLFFPISRRTPPAFSIGLNFSSSKSRSRFFKSFEALDSFSLSSLSSSTWAITSRDSCWRLLSSFCCRKAKLSRSKSSSCSRHSRSYSSNSWSALSSSLRRADSSCASLLLRSDELSLSIKFRGSFGWLVGFGVR